MDNAALYSLAPGVSPTVAATGSASAEQDVTGYTKIWIKSDVDTYVIFGTKGSVTAPTTSNAQYLTANLDYVLDLLPTQTAFVVLRNGVSRGTASYTKAA